MSYRLGLAALCAGAITLAGHSNRADAQWTQPAGAKRPHRHLAFQQFVGWSKDGNRYAAKTSMGSFFPGGGYMAKFVTVYDARTGYVVAQFRGARSLKGAPKGDSVWRVWRTAKPQTAWRTYAKRHGFSKATFGPKNRGWNISTAYKRRSGSKWSKVKIRRTRAGATMKWRWMPPFHKTPFPEIMSKESAAMSKHPKIAAFSPTLHLEVKKAAAAWRLLRTQPTWTLSKLENASNGGGDATLLFYWSPDGKRVAIAVRWAPEGMNEEMNGYWYNKLYIKSVGPQVKVIGAASKFAAVNTIEKLGFPVTQVAKARKRTGAFEVYYRGAAAPAAQRIARALGAGPIKKLKRGGWVHVIVIAKK